MNAQIADGTGAPLRKGNVRIAFEPHRGHRRTPTGKR
jgi:hypothetical protein